LVLWMLLPPQELHEQEVQEHVESTVDPYMFEQHQGHGHQD